jgi:hypothetical protein
LGIVTRRGLAANYDEEWCTVEIAEGSSNLRRVLKPTIPTKLALLGAKFGSFLVVQVSIQKCVEIGFCDAGNFRVCENMHEYRRSRVSAEKSAKNAGVEIERSIEVQFREKSSNLNRLIVNMDYVNIAKIAPFLVHFHAARGLPGAVRVRKMTAKATRGSGARADLGPISVRDRKQRTASLVMSVLKF